MTAVTTEAHLDPKPGDIFQAKEGRQVDGGLFYLLTRRVLSVDSHFISVRENPGCRRFRIPTPDFLAWAETTNYLGRHPL